MPIPMTRCIASSFYYCTNSIPEKEDTPSNKSGFLYSSHVHHSVSLKALQHTVFSCKVSGTTLELWLWFQGDVNQTRNNRANPSSVR